MRIARLNQDFSFQYTSIEKKIFRVMEKNNIVFTHHKSILNLTEVDAFIEPNICIYCDGDYWHANPAIYDYSKLDDNQKWHVERDKRNNYILQKRGYIVLRFWETKIKNDIDNCVKIIQNTISGIKNESS